MVEKQGEPLVGFTVERLEEFIREIYAERIKEKPELEEKIQHYMWEEDGRECSAWLIQSGGMSMMTGDGGMENYLKQFDETLKAIVEKDIQEIRGINPL